MVLRQAHPDVAITKFQLAQTLEYLQQRGTPAVLETDVADETKLNDEKKKLENTYKMGMANPRNPRHFHKIEGGRNSVSGGRTTKNTLKYTTNHIKQFCLDFPAFNGKW